MSASATQGGHKDVWYCNVSVVVSALMQLLVAHPGCCGINATNQVCYSLLCFCTLLFYLITLLQLNCTVYCAFVLGIVQR